MKTEQDDAGVVHEVVDRIDRAPWGTTRPHRRCSGIVVHVGDVYHIHQRALTCIQCASLHAMD